MTDTARADLHRALAELLDNLRDETRYAVPRVLEHWRGLVAARDALPAEKVEETP